MGQAESALPAGRNGDTLMPEQRQTIFANGLVVKPSGNAPRWVKMKLSFKAEEFIKTLQEHVDSQGWVNVQIKEAKSGKLYGEVDTYGKDRGTPPAAGGYRAPRPPGQKPPPPPPPFPSSKPEPQPAEDEHPDDMSF